MQVDRRTLYEGIKTLARIAPTKTNLPILSNTLLTASDGVLTLRATDLDLSLSCQIPADGELTACLPARLLAQLVKPEGRKKAGDVVIEAGEGQVTVVVDGMATQISAMPPETFPADMGARAEDWSLTALWPAGDLLGALHYVLPAASKDSTRPHLCTVCLDAGSVIATDGHRLLTAKTPTSPATSLLLPASAASVLKQILPAGEQVILATGDELFRVRVGPWELTTKLVDAEFPPYRQVIPDRESQPTQISVEAVTLSHAIQKIGRLAENKRVQLRVNGVLAISTSGSELGQAQVQIPTLDNNHDGPDLLIGLDLAYLRDAIAGASERVELGFAGQLDPVRLDLPGDRLAVIMPMRL